MKLTILGCFSASPRKNSFPTSQVLDIKGNKILIDCGEGTQIQLRRYGFKLSAIALPSLRNSGENIIFVELYFFCIFFVKPNGTVDLITTVALEFVAKISEITFSTDFVLNLFVFSS